MAQLEFFLKSGLILNLVTKTRGADEDCPGAK